VKNVPQCNHCTTYSSSIIILIGKKIIKSQLKSRKGKMYFPREDEKSSSIDLTSISAYKYQNFKYAGSIISWSKKTWKMGYSYK
jgi:hypothetical protein